ncbi:MAG: ABC transporter permease [Candidatus Hydrogenedentes bacterium]|nr:ABC transporter permease [Candidatus Hydrogenedentota bacterium]
MPEEESQPASNNLSRKYPAWGQFKKNKPALFGVLLVFVVGFIALFAPFLAGDVPIVMKKDGITYWFPNIITYAALAAENQYANFDRWEPGDGEFALRPPIPYGPLRQDLHNHLTPPGGGHWLGTDDRGRDVLSRIIWGARISMSVGFIAVGIAVFIGIIVGAIAGFYGGVVDAIILRVIEIWICIPSFFLIITVMAFLQPSIVNIMIVIGLTGWPGIARLVRGEFLKQKQQEYAVAARASGLSDKHIIFRHLLPNSLSPVFVSASFGIAGAILTESGLSFLGFGVPPPTASWGEILKQSQNYVDFAWWLVAFPGIAVFITVVSFNLVGDGLRDALDPRLRQ